MDKKICNQLSLSLNRFHTECNGMFTSREKLPELKCNLTFFAHIPTSTTQTSWNRKCSKYSTRSVKPNSLLPVHQTRLQKLVELDLKAKVVCKCFVPNRVRFWTSFQQAPNNQTLLFEYSTNRRIVESTINYRSSSQNDGQMRSWHWSLPNSVLHNFLAHNFSATFIRESFMKQLIENNYIRSSRSAGIQSSGSTQKKTSRLLSSRCDFPWVFQPKSPTDFLWKTRNIAHEHVPIVATVLRPDFEGLETTETEERERGARTELSARKQWLAV
jgi:hypothetical protein